MKKKVAHFSKSSTLVFILTALILIGIAYINALHSPFILDDIWGIRDNPNVGSFSYALSHPLSFLRLFFIWLPYQIGGLDPLLFHLLNVVFHFGTTMFLFMTIKELFEERYAWFAAILFAVHPILTESVTWISALPGPMYSFFFMVSLWLYIKSHKSKDIRWYYGSVAAFVFSILSAEKAVVMPALLLVTEFYYFDLKKNWKRILPFVLGAVIFGGLFVLNIGPRSESFAQDFYVKRDFYNPLVHWPYSITSYLELTFFPKGLTIYHSDRNISYLWLAIRWAAFVAMLGAIVFFYFRKNHRAISYWLIFYLIVLSPTLIPVNIVWMVAERYAYLAVAGIIAAAVYPLVLIARERKYRIPVYILIGVFTAALLIRTVIRNNDWQSEDDMWIATVVTSPWSPSAHNNMGDYYSRHGDYPSAIREFQTTIKLKPDYGDAYHNLGTALMQNNQHKESIVAFNKAVEINPRLWQSHQNLAALYFHVKDYANAIKYAQHAIDYGATSPKMLEIIKMSSGQK